MSLSPELISTLASTHWCTAQSLPERHWPPPPSSSVLDKRTRHAFCLKLEYPLLFISSDPGPRVSNQLSFFVFMRFALKFSELSGSSHIHYGLLWSVLPRCSKCQDFTIHSRNLIRCRITQGVLAMFTDVQLLKNFFVSCGASRYIGKGKVRPRREYEGPVRE